MTDYSINILHIYPDLLNLYGDKGNIECMRKRLEWRGIAADVMNCTTESPDIDFLKADIVFLGGGSDRELQIACEKLGKKKNELADYIENGGVILANCGGFEILGKYYLNGEDKVEGLGILDIHTDKPEDGSRLIGNAILECDGIDDKVVGFENHRGIIDIGSYTPFGKVVKGFGNDNKSGYEGVTYKNLIGTNLHGPLLPKNPELCDRILLNALKNKYTEFNVLKPLDDGIEKLANKYMLSHG